MTGAQSQCATHSCRICAEMRAGTAKHAHRRCSGRLGRCVTAPQGAGTPQVEP